MQELVRLDVVKKMKINMIDIILLNTIVISTKNGLQ